jgi:alkaline phosphatase D
MPISFCQFSKNGIVNYYFLVPAKLFGLLNLIPEENQSQEAFIVRRANAYQADYEHMPLRESSLPSKSNLQLYRRFTFGFLAEFNVLDTRQYRTDQPCNDGLKPRCAQAFDTNATMTGQEQEQCLFQGLDKSRSR